MQSRARATTSPLVPILLVTAAATLVGVVGLRGSEIGVALETVPPGLGPQLGRTVPAALLVLAAVVVNLAAGAVAVRALVGRPFGAPGEAALAGLAGAVLLDVAAMLVLGSVGAFSQAALFAVSGGTVAAGLLVARGRLVPFVESAGDRQAAARAEGPATEEPWSRSSVAAFAIVTLIVWGAPVVLQLGSPVVPFMDVLANHVAPVEHLRSFGSFATLVTSPSPIYGPSRLFLGYVATLGTQATMTDLRATLSVAAFILPLGILAATGAWRAASGLFGPGSAPWVLLTFPLTFTFAQVPDARATVLAFPLVALALERLVAGSATAGREGLREEPKVVLLGIALAAAILVHPALGSCGWLAACLIVIAGPSHRSWAIPALVAAPIIALPQAATTLGLALPAWVGLLPMAVGLAVLLRWRPRLARRAFSRPGWLAFPGPWVLAAVAGTLAVGLILTAPALVWFVLTTAADLVRSYPLLSAGTALAAVLVPRAAGWPVVVAALVVWLAVTVGIGLLPGDSLLEQALRFEVPKALRYWLPWFLAIASAGALAAIWDRAGRRSVLGAAAFAGVLIVVALPVGRDPLSINAVEERRLAESISIQLRRAARGYFTDYPDPRDLIDAGRREIVDALRGEQRAGRLTAGTGVLHLAASFQQRSSTPIGVFTGALETTVTLDPEVSIHTAGGRLFGLDALAGLLDEGFGYVVLEPDGLPAEVRDEVITAGFRPIFENEQGEIFSRGPP